MDFGAVLTSLGAMCVGIGAALVVLAVLKPGFKSLMKAGITTGLVGVVLMTVGAMVKERQKDRDLDTPPALAQPTGYADPVPGGTVVCSPDAGYRPVPVPAGGFAPPSSTPGGSSGAAGGDGSIRFRGHVNLTGVFSGTAAGAAGGQYGQGTLAVESGSTQVAVRP